MFIGWTFFDKNRTNIWLESYSTLIYYAGFALFPFVLFLVYFDLSLTNFALEILPCLLLYQGMIQINNILLIKF